MVLHYWMSIDFVDVIVYGMPFDNDCEKRKRILHKCTQDSISC